MADNRFPQTTVINTIAPSPTPTFGQVFRELMFTAFLIGVIAFVGGGCMAWWLW